MIIYIWFLNNLINNVYNHTFFVSTPSLIVWKNCSLWKLPSFGFDSIIISYKIHQYPISITYCYTRVILFLVHMIPSLEWKIHYQIIMTYHITYCNTNNTARRCVLPGRFKWRLNMFRHYPSTCSNTCAGPVFWDFPDQEPWTLKP